MSEQPASRDGDTPENWTLSELSHALKKTLQEPIEDPPEGLDPEAARIVGSLTKRDHIGLLIAHLAHHGLERSANVSRKGLRQSPVFGIYQMYRLIPKEMEEYGFIPGPMPAMEDEPALAEWIFGSRFRFEKWRADATSDPNKRGALKALNDFHSKNPNPRIEAIGRSVAAGRGYEPTENLQDEAATPQKPPISGIKQEVIGAILTRMTEDESGTLDHDPSSFYVTADGKLTLDEKKISNALTRDTDMTVEGQFKRCAQETKEKIAERVERIMQARSQDPAQGVRDRLDAETIRRAQDLNRLDCLAALDELFTPKQRRVFEDLWDLNIPADEWASLETHELLRDRGHNRDFEAHRKIIGRIWSILSAG